MKNKKILSWIIGLIIIGIILGSDLTSGTKTALVIGIILFLLILELHIRLTEQTKRCTQTIGAVAKYIDEKEENKPASYKIDFLIMPDWNEIIKHVAKELKITEDEFQKEIFKNKKLGIIKGKGSAMSTFL